MVIALCDSCLHYTSCTRYPLFDEPIVYCDEYESRKDSPGIPALPELKGLCRTCRKRFICTLARPEAGVWHCQEYQ